MALEGGRIRSLSETKVLATVLCDPDGRTLFWHLHRASRHVL